MRFKNSLEAFGLVAIVLHWLLALLIISLLTLGLYMVGLPLGLNKLKLYGLHKEIGFIVS